MPSILDTLRSQNISEDKIKKGIIAARRAANQAGMGDSEFNERLGISTFESGPIQDWFVNKAKEVFGKEGELFTKEVFTLDDFFSAGLEYGTTNLAISEPSKKAKKVAAMTKDPDVLSIGPLQAGAEMLGTITSDIPAGVAGFLGGSASGGPVGGFAGAFAFPTILRTALLDAYENGDVDSPERFWDLLTKVSVDGLKSYVTGAATGGVGQIAKPIIGKKISNKVLASVAVTEAEVATFTAVGAALEGRVPTAHDFVAANVAIFGLKSAIAPISKSTSGVYQAAKKKVQKVYEETGLTPNEIVQRANEDPTFREDIASDTHDVPRAAQTPDMTATAKDTTWDPGSPRTREWQSEQQRKVENTPEEAFGELTVDSVMSGRMTPAESLDAIYKRILRDHRKEEMPQATANVISKYVENNQGKLTKYEDQFVALEEPLVVYRGSTAGEGSKTLSTSLSPDVALDQVPLFGELQRITLPVGTKVALPSRSTPVDSTKSKNEVIIHPSEKIVEVRRAINENEDFIGIDSVVDATIQRPEYNQKISQKISVGGKEQKKSYGFNQLYRDVVDDLHPLNVVVKDLMEGKPLSADQNPYTLARLYRGVGGLADSFLEYGALDFANKNRVSKPFRDIVKPIERAGELDAFREYLVARRGLELDKRGVETGLNKQEMTNVVNSGSRFKEAFKDLREYQTKVLEYLRDSGALSKEAFEVIQEANRDYVPFNRVLAPDKSGGMGLRSLNIIKRIRGSTKDIIDPLESIMRNTFAMITIAERNRTMDALVKLHEQNPKLEILKPAKAGTIQVKLESAELQKMLDPYIGKEASKIPDDASFTIFRKKLFVKENTVTHIQDGKAKVYEVNVELAEAIAAMDREALPGVIRFLSLPATTLRTGAILSPDFIARNVTRDTVSATLFSKDGFIPVIDTFRGMALILGKTNAYKDWAASGGMFAHMQAVDRVYLQKGMKQLLTTIPMRNVLYNPIEMLRAIGSLAEQGTRVAVFERRMRKAQKKGKSRIEAMTEAGFESRDITLDFQRFGAKGRAINSMAVFLNAWVQGMDKTARSFKDNPIAMTTKVIGGIAIPSAILHIINTKEKDPQGRYWYRELPSWQRDLFWHFSVGEGKDFTIYRVPKPFELGLIFGTGTERFIDYMKDIDPKALQTFANTMGKSLMPNLLPTFLTVPIEIYSNKSIFFDRPVIPRAREDMLPEYQHGIYTSEVAKAIGSVVQKLPGFRMSKLASPAVIEHAIRGWTGGLGGYALNAMDTALEEVGLVDDSIVPPEKTLADIPLVKAFVARYPTTSTKNVEDFYDNYEKISRFTDSFKALMKDGRFAEAQKVFREQQAAGLMLKVDSYKNMISGYSKMIRKINLLSKMKGMSDQQLARWKRENIDAYYHMINSAAAAGNKMISQMQKYQNQLAAEE